MDTILVTGASGFIGRHLVGELVSRGYDVAMLARQTSDISALQRTQSKVIYGDITHLRSLVEACEGIDAVVHLAAMTSSGEGSDYEKSFQTNVVGCQNLIDACKLNQVSRIIHVSTQSDNSGAYATTKRHAEVLFRESGLNVTIVKPSLVYGSGDRGLFGSMTKFIDRFPVIPIVGSGNYPMRPIYVGDVAQSIISCLEKDGSGGEYLISGPEEVSYSQYLDSIAQAMGLTRKKVHIPYPVVFAGVSFVSLFWKGFPISVDTLKGLVNPRVYDSEAAERDLAFGPIPLEEGLRRAFSIAPEET